MVEGVAARAVRSSAAAVAGSTRRPVRIGVYNLTLGVGVRNVFNNVNVANPNASTGLQDLWRFQCSARRSVLLKVAPLNRRIELQATFAF